MWNKIQYALIYSWVKNSCFFTDVGVVYLIGHPLHPDL